MRDHTERQGRAEKKQEINQVARERYIVIVRFLGLDNRRHLDFKLDVKNTYVKSKEDVLPVSLTHLLNHVQAYKEPNARHKAPTVDPKPPGVALLKARECARIAGHPDANRIGGDMTGIRNKAGREGCNKCGARDHWKATCQHADASPAELAILWAKYSASPQLVTVGVPDDGAQAFQQDVSAPNMWDDLEGVTMVSPTTYFVTPKLDPNKIYPDCCASHG